MAAVTPSHATEGGGSDYPIGVNTINPGVEPTPAGFNFLSYNNFYTADRVNNSDGKSAVPDFHLDSLVLAPRLDFTLPNGTLPYGIQIGVQFIQPIVHLDTGSGPATAHQYHNGWGFGDPTFVPLAIGQNFNFKNGGGISHKFKVSLVEPFGTYKTGAGLNFGRKYTSYQATYGAQWNPNQKSLIGAAATFITNTTDTVTHYKSGQEFDVDYAAGFSPANHLNLEINGYYYRQLTADTVNGLIFQDGHYGQVFAVGPQIRYASKFGAFTVKWDHEMLVKNRAQGEKIWLQVLKRLG